MEILDQIKDVFKPPKKRLYLGIASGYPYFLPINFLSTIISIRKLVPKTESQIKEYLERYPYFKDSKDAKYANYPMVNRNKYWIKNVFGSDYLIKIGWPIYVDTIQLGWKDKYDSPRFEWSPSFHIYFFWWQFSIFWNAPDGDNDQYYEQILWYLKYSNKDIVKAKESWPWVDSETKKSTWKDKYLCYE